MSKQDNVTASQRKLSSHDEGDSGILGEKDRRECEESGQLRYPRGHGMKSIECCNDSDYSLKCKRAAWKCSRAVDGIDK